MSIPGNSHNSVPDSMVRRWPTSGQPEQNVSKSLRKFQTWEICEPKRLGFSSELYFQPPELITAGREQPGKTFIKIYKKKTKPSPLGMSEQVMKSQEIPRNRRKFATILNIPRPFFGTLFVGHFLKKWKVKKRVRTNISLEWSLISLWLTMRDTCSQRLFILYWDNTALRDALYSQLLWCAHFTCFSPLCRRCAPLFFVRF